MSIDFSPDAKQIAVALRGALVIAEVPQGRTLFESRSIFAGEVNWSADGKLLVIKSGADLHVIDKSGRSLRKIAEAGRNARGPAIRPGGDIVAVLTDKLGVPQLYDVASGRLLLSFHGIQGGRSMAWSPNGNTLAVATTSGYVELLSAPPAEARTASAKLADQSSH
jgi:Tol biopolymer transport system component